MDLSDIYKDLAAFADNEEDVIIDKGLAVFQRGQRTWECKLSEVGGDVFVEFEGQTIPYKRFLAEELGRLSILANAIRQKRKDVTPYIDTRASLSNSLGEPEACDSALERLRRDCRSRPVGETKLLFLTADAGHGKTALLRRLTRRFADEYLDHKVDMLLFHIDTQGRSFVRLEEAVMRDLGQLRISGLFYPGVIRLIRGGFLAIAVDGFDELLAEIGVGEAYSGLGGFLHQLEGHGVVIASARSAYFELENYAAASRLLTSLPGTHVTVQHMRLERWNRLETVRYFELFEAEDGSRIRDPSELYDELAERLGSEHPVLHRPFLVHRMAVLLASTRILPGQLAEKLGSSPIEVVPNVIQALLQREVEEKWRDPSGQPYLSLSQHTLLLAAIADEMWTQGKNTLPVETVQVVCEAMVDDLRIPPAQRVQIVQRIKAHALLPMASNGDLSFDHEEFLNYFLAVRLVQLLKSGDDFGLKRFLELHSLPTIVGTWTANIEPWPVQRTNSIVSQLSGLAKQELRSTYLKQNVGVIGSQFARRAGCDPDCRLQFDSVYFEGALWTETILCSALFQSCTFIGVDFSGVKWTACRFVSCTFDGLTYDENTKLTRCSFDPSSRVVGTLRVGGEGGGLKNYVPDECRRQLEELGAVFESAPVQMPLMSAKALERKRTLSVFLRVFNRNSGATGNVTRMKLGPRFSLFRDELLPMLKKHGVVRETEYRGEGHQPRWEIAYPLETILKAEDRGSGAPDNLSGFWEELRNR